MANTMSGVGSINGTSKPLDKPVTNPPQTRPKDKPAWVG